MTVQDLEHEALADYSGLLCEAADVLLDLLSADPQHRAEDLSDLLAIHAESTEYVLSAPLSEELRAFFDGLVETARRIAGGHSQTSQVRAIHHTAHALAATLERPVVSAAELDRFAHDLQALAHPDAV